MQYKDSAPNFAPSAEKTKKKLTRADFKKDVEEAVKKGIKKPPRAKRATKVKTGAYATWKVSELRTHLNQKKNALLTKAGFPEGKLPRSKVAMIALCKRLKRKRW